MKVLLISHTCVSPIAGRPKAEWLARGGIDLRVLVPHRWRDYGRWQCTPEVNEDPRLDGRTGQARYQVGKVRLPWAGPAQWYLHWYPRLAALLQEFRPDVIDLWEEPWGLVSAHTCWLRNRLLPTAKIVVETEQNVEKKLPMPFENFRRYSLKNAAHAIGRNAESVEVLRRKGYAGPATVVPNGVDEELFRPMQPEEGVTKLGKPAFTAGYVGRLVPEKGLMDFLNALSLCPSEIEGVFVGEGPMHAQLEAKILDLSLESRVRILPPMGIRDLPRLINTLNVLVLPSRTTPRWKEQFGRVIIEAQACGVPVLGSDSGAIPAVVGKGGWIFPEGDVEKLAAFLQMLHQSPEVARERGRVGREQVLQSCTWRKIAEQMHRIYHSAMNSPLGARVLDEVLK